MQKCLKPENVKSPKELEEKLGKQSAKEERLELTRKFRFLSQENNPLVKRRVSADRVKYQSFYGNHKRAIDKLHYILRKYYINEDDFLKYALEKYKVYTPELLLKDYVFKEYAEKKHLDETYWKIYNSYSKSIRFIAETCLNGGFSPRDFLAGEFRSGRISYDFISGKISKYLMVSIQNFKKLYEFLDPLSKDELRIIYDATDELKVMVNEAVFKETGKYPKPIRDSEEELEKLKNKLTKENN